MGGGVRARSGHAGVLPQPILLAPLCNFFFKFFFFFLVVAVDVMIGRREAWADCYEENQTAISQF